MARLMITVTPGPTENPTIGIRINMVTPSLMKLVPV